MGAIPLCHPIKTSNKYYYIVGTQQIVLLSICKSGNTFRLIEPSPGQFINHIEGTFSRGAHCGIPNVYRSYGNKRYKWLYIIIQNPD